MRQGSPIEHHPAGRLPPPLFVFINFNLFTIILFKIPYPVCPGPDSPLFVHVRAMGGRRATRQGSGHKNPHMMCGFHARIHTALPVAPHPLPCVRKAENPVGRTLLFLPTHRERFSEICVSRHVRYIFTTVYGCKKQQICYCCKKTIPCSFHLH